MQTLTLNVRGLDDNLNDFAQAWKTPTTSEPVISFATAELLWQVLTADRWEILKAMTGAGSLTLGTIATRVGRSTNDVRNDLRALFDAGLIEQRQDEHFCFPYDAVHIDFMLKAA